MAAKVARGGIRRLRSLPKSSTKHVLTSPYDLTWPSLEKGVNKEILDEISRTLEPLLFHELLTSRKVKKCPLQGDIGRNEDEKQEEKNTERAKKLELRSCLVIGTNEVIRALEKGSVKLVLISRSLKLGPLSEHIMVLSAACGIPACAISSMDEQIPTLLGVKQVATFGFRIIEKETPFDALVEFIKSKIPPLHVPWLETWKNQEQPVKTMTMEANNKAMSKWKKKKEPVTSSRGSVQVSCHNEVINKAGSTETCGKQQRLRLQERGYKGKTQPEVMTQVEPRESFLPNEAKMTELKEPFPSGSASLPESTNEGNEAMSSQEALEDEPVARKKRKRGKTKESRNKNKKMENQPLTRRKKLSDVKVGYLRPAIKTINTEKGQNKAEQ